MAELKTKRCDDCGKYTRKKNAKRCSRCSVDFLKRKERMEKKK